jgi:hypothetical protein
LRLLVLALALLVPTTASADKDKDEPRAAAREQAKPLSLTAFDLVASSPQINRSLLPMLDTVAADGRFERLISGADLRELITLDAQKQAFGCESSGCLVALSSALYVPYLLTSDLGFVGQRYVFNLKLLDVAAARVIARAGGMASAESELPELVKSTTGEALNRFFAIVAPTAAARAPETMEERPGIAVLDLKAVHGVKASMAAVLSDIMLGRMAEANRFASIVAGEDLRDMLSLEQQKASLGCGDDSCMTEIGGALGVPLMAVLSAGRVGQQSVLSLKVIAVEEAQVWVCKNIMVSSKIGLPAAVLSLTDEVLKDLFGADALLSNTQIVRPYTRSLIRRGALVFGLASVSLAGWRISSRRRPECV